MTEQTVDTATLRLANRLFRIMRQTFVNRGLCQQRKDGSLREVEWVGWTPWPEERASAFVLDTGTLPVSIEKLTDERVVHQVSTALGGRRVEVVNHRGVAWRLAKSISDSGYSTFLRFCRYAEAWYGCRDDQVDCVLPLSE